MKVRWTPEAEDDRAQIFDYIAADSPRSAIEMDEMDEMDQDTVWVLALVHTARQWPPVAE